MIVQAAESAAEECDRGFMSGVKDADIGVVEKYLALWVALCMVVGVHTR